ncbi:MAG: phosphatase PAP2 family protein [Gemmataceae bacterium]|nr:phosphatase PAP2 family protein [Gemmataceae bacterium]
MRRTSVSKLLLALALSICGPTVVFAQLEPKLDPIVIDLPMVVPVPAVIDPNIPNPVFRMPPADPAIPAPKFELPVSPNTGLPRPEVAPEYNAHAMAVLAFNSSNYTDPRYIANSYHPDDMGVWEILRDSGKEQTSRLLQDFKNFYLSENMFYVAGAVALAAPIANSQMDQRFRDWYQKQGRTKQADDAALFVKNFGEFKYAIPGYLAMSLSGRLFSDHPFMTPIGEFGDRGLRALAVGAPMVGVLQYGLGASRPGSQDSRWHPFSGASNSASGHTFVGAVPFLTAASMVESKTLKVLLIAGSMATGWSRIHTDDHYLAQTILGWSMAYLAVEAISRTEDQRGKMRIVPLITPNGGGMGVEFRY